MLMEGAEPSNLKPAASSFTPAAAEHEDASAKAAESAADKPGCATRAAAGGSAGTSEARVRRFTGSLSTVFLLLHIHLLPVEQELPRQRLKDVRADAAAITRSFTAALLHHTGLVGVALLPFKVLSYDSRLSLSVVKTDSVSAPALILAAANIHSLRAVAAVRSSTSVTVPCFVTLVRTAACLHGLACPRRPTAMLLMHEDPDERSCSRSSGSLPHQQHA